MTETKNYFEVIAKCGHVGKKHYVPIKFAVIAEDGKEAAKKVRDFPRVKHHHKDAILNVTKIDYDRYLEIVQMNHNDAYLNCHSRQEQKNINKFEERLVEDFHNKKNNYDKEDRLNRIAYKLKKFKIIEKLCWEDSNYVYSY